MPLAGLRHDFAMWGLNLFRSVDVTIKHHWAREHRVSLNVYRHKGYWVQGARREWDTMKFIAAQVRPGMTVWDVGAHIGYVTVFMSHLVGEAGRVLAFEPGLDNLRYLRRN